MTSLLDRVEGENKGLRQDTATLRQELERTRAELAKERARADMAVARAREAEASSPHLGRAASRLERARARREEAAAVLLQANWRGRHARMSALQVAQAASKDRLLASPRLRAAQSRHEHVAATLVQAHWRGSRTRAPSPVAPCSVPSGNVLHRLEQAERDRDRLQAEVERVTSDLRAQARAVELKQSRASSAVETLVVGLVERAEAAEARAAAAEAAAPAGVASNLRAQDGAAELNQSRTATAVETLVAGLVERTEAAEARAAAAEAAAPAGAAPVDEGLKTEADNPLSQERVIQWAQELDTIVRLEELLRASEGTVKLLQHGVSETVASLKQQSPVKRKA